MAKDKISIEEQVAGLTVEEQDKLLKVGKIATIVELIIGIPWMIISLLGVFVLADPPLGFDYANYDKLIMGFFIWLFLGFVFFAGVLIFVKVKYPYYSDARWKYINKMRKGK